MGIDKKTVPSFVNVVLDNNKDYLKELKEQADEDGQSEEKENSKLSLTMEKHSFEMDEYYYDDDNNEITVSGNMISTKGQSYVSICIPLSDVVLIDIISGALKKLNKLKTTLEALK